MTVIGIDDSDAEEDEVIVIVMDQTSKRAASAVAVDIDGDDNDVAGQARFIANPECPLTGAAFDKMDRRDIVRNKLCGHLYSKEAVSVYLASKSGTRCTCPMAGCSRSLCKSNLRSAGHSHVH